MTIETKLAEAIKHFVDDGNIDRQIRLVQKYPQAATLNIEGWSLASRAMADPAQYWPLIQAFTMNGGSFEKGPINGSTTGWLELVLVKPGTRSRSALRGQIRWLLNQGASPRHHDEADPEFGALAHNALKADFLRAEYDEDSVFKLVTDAGAQCRTGEDNPLYVVAAQRDCAFISNSGQADAFLDFCDARGLLADAAERQTLTNPLMMAMASCHELAFAMVRRGTTFGMAPDEIKAVAQQNSASTGYMSARIEHETMLGEIERSSATPSASVLRKRAPL